MMDDGSSPRPLRLLVDLTQLLPGGAGGGVKPFLFEYLGALGRQRRFPVAFTFLTATRTHAQVRALARAAGDELICVRDDGPGAPLSAGVGRGLRERRWFAPPDDLAAQLRADVLFCPLSWTEFHCPGVPLVATVVDVLHRDYPFTLRPSDNVHRERLFAAMLRLTDRFQCISDWTAERMTFHYGVPTERLFRTHVAVHGRFEASSSQATGESTTVTAPFFFYPANAWVHKNHEVLLMAYGIYRREIESVGGQPWPLVLTGHEDARMQKLRALAETLGLESEGAVRFAGHVDVHRLKELWRGAGALVFPSLHEGFGIPLTEAMTHGVPILCGRDGAVPEVVGDAGLAVDVRRPRELAAAMTRLAGDADLRRELAARGRVRLERFSLETETRNFLDALRDVAARPARITSKGWWPEDGWTGPRAFFGPVPIPTGERGRLRLRLRAMPAARRVRLHDGDRPLGGWDLAAGVPHVLESNVHGGRGPLRVDAPDAWPSAPDDPRPRGVWIEAMSVQRADGREFDLLPVTGDKPPAPSAGATEVFP